MTNSELMQYVRDHPGESGNIGRLSAVKANLLLGKATPQPLPADWRALYQREARVGLHA